MPRASLYEEINNLIVERLKEMLLTEERVNVPDWLSDMAACIADLILEQPEDEQAKLAAHAHKELDQHISERRPRPR